MKCSVIICTRNRAQQIATVLESFLRMIVPDNLSWELVIVDNGSTDDTQNAVLAYKSKLPIKLIREDRPGLSNARNAGVQQASGDYILWTDDDVELDKNWLSAYAEAFCKWPEAAVFAGKVEPTLLPETPDWFKDVAHEFSNLLAKRDFGAVPHPLSVKEDILPYGANYAIRSKEQKTQLYDPDLGVAPGRRRGGEETEAVKAILGKGAHGFWVPGACVKHLIPSSRQSVKYILEYYSSAGELEAHLFYRKHKAGAWHLLPLYILKTMISGSLFAALLIMRTKMWPRFAISYAGNAGKTKYLLDLLCSQRAEKK